MNFPPVTPAAWREQVEKELKGASFDKVLVQRSVEGLAIAPLYTESPAAVLATGPAPARPFRICMRHSPAASLASLATDLDGGAEALWLALDDRAETLAGRADLAERVFLVLDAGPDPAAALGRSALLASTAAPRFALDHDPLARGDTSAEGLARLASAAKIVSEKHNGSTSVMISTLPYHEAGADAADEIAIALATGVRYLETLLEAGLEPAAAGAQIALRIAADRDTFLSLGKVRALRACWQKLLVASGVAAPARTLVHAVCSPRTLSVRDPWVNMLRVTTQMFAAILGGADLVTPMAFDEALGEPSDHGRRVARNTGLVLREESYLGRVNDPAAGSYYLDTLTDALAREGWSRFRALEKDGGIVDALASGRLAAKLEAAWHTRLEAITKRRLPVLGVSEFANLGETLPAAREAGVTSSATAGLPRHRDAEAFEALRDRAGTRTPPPEAVLVTLGTLAESRARVGFAIGFFAAGGIASRETTKDEKAAIACLCGTDERYALEAVDRVKALKAAGCARVLVAGRPGALEADLRAAGVDGFIFVGCDVVATLTGLLGDTER